MHSIFDLHFKLLLLHTCFKLFKAFAPECASLRFRFGTDLVEKRFNHRCHMCYNFNIVFDLTPHEF